MAVSYIIFYLVFAISYLFLTSACWHRVKKKSEELREYAHEYEYYKIECDVPLEDAQRQPFPRSMTFEEVVLIGCGSPNFSYVTGLQALNMSVTKKLSLINVPVDSRFSHASLTDLPVTLQEFYLHVSSVQNKTGRLRSQQLTEIPLGLLPANLSILELENTGLRVLKAEAVNVPAVKITEDNLITFTGTAPRMLKLWLAAPVWTLPVAPALSTLTLYSASPQRIAYSALRTLKLHQMRLRSLPIRFLRGCSNLRVFVATQNRFISLPGDLFSYSPEMVSVDLTNNSLFILPSNQFTNLKKLLTLNLSTNLLKATDLATLRELTSLTELDLSWNLLWDLCPCGISHLASLQQLTKLNLSNTDLTSFCPDWRHLKSLRTLDVSNNLLSSIHCDDLPAHLDDSGNLILKVRLNNNPIETIHCSELERTLVAIELAKKQGATLLLSQTAQIWIKDNSSDYKPIGQSARCSG